MGSNSRYERTHLLSEAMPSSPLAPRHITQKEFGQRVRRLMIERGWTQAELARRSALTRDSISTYIRGLTYPTGKSLHALARAFNVPPDSILPNHMEQAIAQDDPSFEMKVSSVDPSMAWIRVNRLVPADIAVKIVQLLNDNAPKGE